MPRRDRVVVLAFVALHVTVPALLLALRWDLEGAHPVGEYRYSWQMYSTAGGSTAYVGVDADGRESTLSVSALPPVVRGIAYDDTVPRLLCERDDDLVAVVRVTGEPGLEDDAGRYAC